MHQTGYCRVSVSDAAEFRVERACKLGETFPNLRARPRGESEGEGWVQFCFHETGRERRGSNADLRADRHDRRQICLATNPRNEMQPRFRNLQPEMFSEQPVELLDEKISAIGIQLPHPFDVAEEVSLGQKASQRRLIDRR